MSQTTSRKRPWLAVLLAAVATGLGHLYLRRWRRALGWLAVLFGTTALFVEPATLDALANGEAVNVGAIAPVLVAGSLSIADAYVLARAHNSARLASEAAGDATLDGDVSTGEARDDERPACPDCGRDLDPELDFCHWCNTEVGGRDAS
ncbi:zinc ribbon domain-containing protein [Halorussus halobius]|uniref:zinc ribbon domain-containing protein n=1 Tax=Halorussus halobius TaxID=1710537 RepID=UPI001092D3E5|nr:zinc ribbon domain-containing protein [Halorussus halobius]